MKNSKDFQIVPFKKFFKGIDWDMLAEQRNLLFQVYDQHMKLMSIPQRESFLGILKMILYWMTFKVYDEVHTVTIETNWQELKKQKSDYLELMESLPLTDAQDDAMEGILNGIDAFQDAAVDELGIPADEVFTLTVEEKEK